MTEQKKKTFGFVMIRHVCNKNTNQYWMYSYYCIRALYPTAPIVIIDDNSNPDFLKKSDERILKNCQIINSTYLGRGEILGYYYFWKHHWFDYAVIIHDSVFIHKPIDIFSCQKIKFMWYFKARKFDNVPQEERFLSKIDQCYVDFYRENDEWKGCFGCMSVITHDFISEISDIFKLMIYIRTRDDRCCVERILAVMSFYHYPDIAQDLSYLGDIHLQIPQWGYNFFAYRRDRLRHLDFPPLVKIWTGR